ncbi:MAG: glycosyl hydrolase family 8 [Desulfosoma sp.]
MRVKISVVFLGMILVMGKPFTALGLERALWDSYKNRFVSPDGRIIDRMNRQISHSEGQGYGLILSVSVDDRQAFDLIWQWTQNNLQVRGSDRLLAWAWGQRPNGKWRVLDLNNATDGDLLVIYGLLKGFERWGDAGLRTKALELAGAVKEHLIGNIKDRPLLLPGYYGFFEEQGLVVNLSYYFFPAFQILARYDNDPIWNRLVQSGLEMLNRFRSLSWNLPPDWILVREEAMEVFKKRSSRFGYEAVRIPLYLAWADHREALQQWSGMLDWVDRNESLPLWVDVLEPAVSLDEAPGGFHAVWAAAAQKLNKLKTAEKLWRLAREKVVHEKEDYYSNTLYLLSLRSVEGL